MRRRFLAVGLAIIMTISSVPVNALAEEKWESTQAEDIGDMLITDGAEEVAAQDITYEISESMTEAAESDDLLDVSEDTLDDVSDLENGILEDGFDLTEEDSLISVKEDIDEEEAEDGSFAEEDIAPDSLADTEELSDDGFLDTVNGSDESLEDGFLIADDEEAGDYDEPMPEESETDSLQILEDYADDNKENVIDLEEEEEESAENLAFSDDSQDDSAFDTAEALQVGAPATVELDEAGKRVVFSFTPNEDGEYIFVSQDITSGDPIGYLYDANRDLIAENDDSDGSNFRISKNLEAGKTYYLQAADYNDSAAEYTVMVSRKPLSARALGAEEDDAQRCYLTVSAGEEITLEVEASVATGEIYYQWYDPDWDPIEETTGASCTIIVSCTGTYRCEVSDDYGNEETIYFYITIDNSLTVRAVGADDDEPDYCYRTVNAGEEITLEVEASVAAGEIYYRWYDPDGDEIEGETSALYTMIPNQKGKYRCEVSDEYGNEETIYFHITIDNSLSARAVGSDNDDPQSCYWTVVAGEEITLEVDASVAAGEIYYKWYDPEMGTIEQEMGASCTIIPSYTGDYRCEVSDEYGNEETIIFYITVDNCFSAWAVRTKDDSPLRCDCTVAAGEEITLEVGASVAAGEIYYKWYDPEVGTIEQEMGASYTTIPNYTDEQYYCEVSDEYGNEETIYFYITIDNSFSAKAVGSDEDNPLYCYRMIPAGEKTTLEVEASVATGEIHYMWFAPEWDYIQEETGTPSSVITSHAGNYYCRVSDGYGNWETISFYVEVDTSLSARAVGSNEDDPHRCERTLASGEEITLEVEASVAVGELYYQWYEWYRTGDYDPDFYGYWGSLGGENGASCTINHTGRYLCKVSDDYGNEERINFYITIGNSLLARAVGSDDDNPQQYYRTVTAGEEITLEVEASEADGKIYYHWYDTDTPYWDYIEGESGASFTIVASRTGRYRCEVSDDSGNWKVIYFYITIDNSLSVKAVGSGDDTPQYCHQTVSAGEEITLEVEASTATGKTYYQWYDLEGDEIEGEKRSSCTIIVRSAGTYRCKVSDDYGNEETVIFDVTIEDTCNHETDGGKITKSPTCTTPGEKTYTCKKCGEVLRKESIPAAGHKAVADAAVAATCTTTGKSAGTHCSVCGTVITAQKTIPATGHKWDAGKVTKEPTDKEEGIVTYTCSVCKGTKTEHLPKLSAEEAQRKVEGDPSDPTSVAGAEKAMTAVKDSGEPAGSSFAVIQLQSKKQTKNSIALSWNKVKGATGYIVYGNRCGTKYKLARLAKQKKNSFTYKKLKKGTYYKFSVAAYKLVNGREQVIGSSKMIHVATAGGKVTNVKSVTVTVKKKNVKKLALKTKKSAKLVAKVTAQNKKAKLKKHRVIKYESSNPKIAKVNAKGKVTAKKKGKCFIYVYSQNGVFAKVTVNVK